MSTSDASADRETEPAPGPSGVSSSRPRISPEEARLIAGELATILRDPSSTVASPLAVETPTTAPREVLVTDDRPSGTCMPVADVARASSRRPEPSKQG